MADEVVASKALADMRQTVPDRSDTQGLPENEHAEPVAPEAPAQEPDYRIYLRIEGVPGESVAVHHDQWIEALAYTHALRHPSASEEALPPTFEIKKYVDRASPALYHAAYSGRVFTAVVIDVCRTAEAAERFLRIEMSDSAISEVRQTANPSSGQARPTETIVFDYKRIRWTYTKLRREDAAPVGNTSCAWTGPAAEEMKSRNKGRRAAVSQSQEGHSAVAKFHLAE